MGFLFVGIGFLLCRKIYICQLYKTTHLKHLFLTVLASSICIGLFAAEDNNWKTYYKSDQVEILYRSSDCHDAANGIHQQKMLLRLVNKTNGKTEISFSKELTYDGSKHSYDVNTFSVQLQAKETKEGLCSDKNGALIIFSKHLDFKGTELRNFELKNISVKTIE